MTQESMNEEGVDPRPIAEIVDSLTDEQRYQHYVFIKNNLEKFELFGIERIQRAILDYEQRHNLRK